MVPIVHTIYMVSYIMGKESALRRNAEVADEEVNFKYRHRVGGNSCYLRTIYEFPCSFTLL